ncbi:MAG: peptidase, partial [Thermoanaerobaculia bacterium]
MAVEKKRVQEFAKRERRKFESNLRDLVEIPSVSADPSRKKDMQRAAEAGAELICELGGKAKIVK